MQILLFGLIAAALLVSCSQGDQPEVDADRVAHDSIVLSMPGMDSLTVFDILRADHDVDFRSTAMGVFISRIDSMPNSRNHFWVYSVNGIMASEACDKRLTRTGDVVRWHFRRFGD